MAENQVQGDTLRNRLRAWLEHLRALKLRERLGQYPVFRSVAIAVCLLGLVSALLVLHHYREYGKRVETLLRDGAFDPSPEVLAFPASISVGDRKERAEWLTLLREAGYSTQPGHPVGHFEQREHALSIHPGPRALFPKTPVEIHLSDGRVERIVSLATNEALASCRLEPRLITNLYDVQRAKRRLVTYDQVPEHLREAILAIEDHRFFEHQGMDPIRTAKAAYEGIVEWRTPRGTSTLTQQLARSFFLTRERSYSRKLAELFIAWELEHRLTKEQILEYYCNEVPMGGHGSFSIVGLGQAADVFFNKHVADLTVAEAALLAGMIQRPSYLNPFRHPARAIERRDMVLVAMFEHGFVSQQARDSALNEELRLAASDVDVSDAPYFVDLVNKELSEVLGDRQVLASGHRIYTTLDADLQREAVEATRSGMEKIDEHIAKQKRFRDQTPPRAEAALVALDPKTGEVRALVGGRDYVTSQLNRVLAKRQPGSVFKPFVYAAAINTAVDPKGEVLTTASTFEDVPTIFWWEGEAYEPANYSQRVNGLVTVRAALTQSLNVPTVRLAEAVGYGRVAKLARRAGLGQSIGATPSVALGSYEVSPFELAGGYTVFANGGVRAEPSVIRTIRDKHGSVVFEAEPQTERVLDERVSFVMTDMLQGVLNRGTAYRARAQGFQEPAAGKTGTDEDGWFAGYTNNLLVVVWVGFDDNTDLELTGAESALPIWTDFMKRAHELPAYRKPKPFAEVEGIVRVELDPDTFQLATARCPNRYSEIFISGTEPQTKCPFHSEGLLRRVVNLFR